MAINIYLFDWQLLGPTPREAIDNLAYSDPSVAWILGGPAFESRDMFDGPFRSTDRAWMQIPGTEYVLELESEDGLFELYQETGLLTGSVSNLTLWTSMGDDASIAWSASISTSAEFLNASDVVSYAQSGNLTSLLRIGGWDGFYQSGGDKTFGANGFYEIIGPSTHFIHGTPGRDRLVQNFDSLDTVAFLGNGNDSWDGHFGDVAPGSTSTISGGSGNDHLTIVTEDRAIGGLGNDTIVAMGREETIDGGFGNDVVRIDTGGSLSAIAFVFGGNGDDLVSPSGSAKYQSTVIAYGDDGNDTMTSGYNSLDRLYGGAGNDLITDLGAIYFGIYQVLDGGKGNDTISGEYILYGGAGRDSIYSTGDEATITGGAGNDLLFGKSGAEDVFIFDGRSGSDIVYNFEPSLDTLELNVKGDPNQFIIADHVTEQSTTVIFPNGNFKDGLILTYGKSHIVIDVPPPAFNLADIVLI